MEEPDEQVQLENVHLCLFGDDFPSTDGADEVNQLVRFYGGVFHNEVRFVDKGEDRLTIWEGLPFSYSRPTSDYAEAIKVRHHHYRRLWLSLGEWSKPFSVFVYEGWD